MTPTARANTAPRRTISLVTATCIVVANMIGVMVFTSLGFQLRGLSSGFSILALWSVGGVCALCGALAYGELAAALPRSGGEYHYLSEIYHPMVGFLAGWLSLTVGFAAPIAVAAMAFGRYFHAAIPALDPLLLSLGVVALVMAVHLFGPRVGGPFQVAATTLKVSLIIGLVAAGAILGTPQPMALLPAPGDGAQIASASFAENLVFVMYAYSGWNASTYIVNEIRDPGRNVPRSIAIGTLLVMALYIAVNATFLRVTPIPEIMALEHKEDVAHLAARHIFGPEGGRLIAGLIAFGLVSAISAMTWVGPRVAMSMGEDCRGLSWLGQKTRSGIPAVAIVVQSSIVFALLLTATFERVVTYIQLALTTSSFLAVLGVIVLRIRQPELHRPYRTWGYPVTPFIFLAVSAWMIWHIVRSNPAESLAGLATLAVGLTVYALSPRTPPPGTEARD